MQDVTKNECFKAKIIVYAKDFDKTINILDELRNENDIVDYKFDALKTDPQFIDVLASSEQKVISLIRYIKSLGIYVDCL